VGVIKIGVDEWVSLNETFTDLYTKLEQKPHDADELLTFLFERLKDGKFLNIENIENRIHELANTNPDFSRSYILKYSREFRDRWWVYESPQFIRFFLPDNIGFVISAVKQIDHSPLPERMIKMQFLRALIQKCDANCQNLDNMQFIAIHLAEITNSIPYVENPFKPSDMNTYQTLVDKSLSLISKIEERAHLNDLNFKKIQSSLSTYPFIGRYCADFLQICIKNRTYSPLLELLSEESPSNNALLSEINEGIRLSEMIKNGKYSTPRQLAKGVQDRLCDENQFWTLVTEFIITNRFGCRKIVVKDKKIGLKDIDLEVQLSRRKILLEITTPDLQRDAQIQGSGFLSSKFDSAIDAKRKQLTQGLASNCDPSLKEEDLLFYVVIDGSYTPYAYEFIDLFTHNNQESDIVGGVIIVRRNDSSNNCPLVQLSGRIIHNPKGRNALSKKEENELCHFLFRKGWLFRIIDYLFCVKMKIANHL